LPTLDQAVGMHLAQLLEKDFLRDAWQHPSQLTKSARPVGQTLKKHRLPTALDDPDGGVERAGGSLAKADVHGLVAPA